MTIPITITLSSTYHGQEKRVQTDISDSELQTLQKLLAEERRASLPLSFTQPWIRKLAHRAGVYDFGGWDKARVEVWCG